MMQSSIESAFRSLDRIPILDGQLIQNVAVTTSEKTIAHSLKRIPKGFIVVDVNNNCLVYRSSEHTQTNIYLTGSRVATISLWVF